MAFTEDFSVFFSNKDFAVEAKITLPNNSTRNISVIFDKQIQTVELLDSTIAANTPNFLCKTEDLSGVKRGNSVLINSVNYSIERMESDGTGTSTVLLRT